MDMTKIGQLIARKRKAFGYTQDELGERLGISGKAVSKWERGLSFPDVLLLKRLALELKINLTQLFDGDTHDPSQSSNLLQCAASAPQTEYSEYEFVECGDTDTSWIVSPYLFGNNLEHTRSSVCGGLSAQMLKNRKFVGKPSVMEGVALDWFAIGKAQIYCSFAEPYTRHESEHYHMHRLLECNAQAMTKFADGEAGGIGQHGLCLDEKKTYDFAIVVKATASLALTVSLTDRSGKRVYAKTVLQLSKSEEWLRYTATLTPIDSDSDADLRLTFSQRGGITVGSVSLMDQNNFRGMRLDVIEAMQALGIRVLRWPGGNFAGEYHWFDGLLPVDERAPFASYMHLETQPHTHGYDFHEINTDDFIALCRRIGAEPFLTINATWNTPEENAAWVEYCNGDLNTKYGRLRAERGNPEPYNVMLWSLGNEFGYGHMEGDNSASGYSHLAKENGKRMLQVCPNLTFCSSGPYPNREWVDYAAKPLSDISGLVSLHFYGHAPCFVDPWKEKAEYEDCVNAVKAAREQLYAFRSMLDDRLSISFDEWNAWYGWYRPSCVTDGIFTALMLHLIIKEAQLCRIGLACHFEAVNESAITVTPKAATLSATGQALALMKAHANGRLCYASDYVIVTERKGSVTVTAVNPSYDAKRKVAFPRPRGRVEGKLYQSESVLPHTHFEEAALPLTFLETLCEAELPPHSMAIWQFDSEKAMQ